MSSSGCVEMESSNSTPPVTESFEDSEQVARGDISPGIQWEGDSDVERKRDSRILVLDHLPREVERSQEEHPGVVVKEIYDIAALKSIYKEGKDADSTLRVFHVQNSPWATEFLIRRFCINGFELGNNDGGDGDDVDDGEIVYPQELAGWLLQKEPKRRAGKPFLIGKSWKMIVDPWRRLRKCSFGLDYMKHYSSGNDMVKNRETCVAKLMGYDDNDDPGRRYNVYSQRLSVYVQYAAPELPIPGPVLLDQGLEYNSRRSEGPYQYDNGSTIIIFDNSETHSIGGSLIPARGEEESRWWCPASHTTNNCPEEDEKMALECMRTITHDIFKALANCWDQLLDASLEHVGVLEEKIYAEPENENPALELWTNLAHWLKYEKLMSYHGDIVNEMRKHLVAIDGDLEDEGHWLKESPDDFDRLSTLIQNDLVKRTNNLSELMYKSVAIRDARESLKLGTSMWRLSWITFIFLPLTFIVGFFGMNVDIFTGSPSLKWYFIAAVPFMVLVFGSWFLLKYLLTGQRKSSRQPGINGAQYADPRNPQPQPWSLVDPRNYIWSASADARGDGLV